MRCWTARAETACAQRLVSETADFSASARRSRLIFALVTFDQKSNSFLWSGIFFFGETSEIATFYVFYLWPDTLLNSLH